MTHRYSVNISGYGQLKLEFANPLTLGETVYFSLVKGLDGDKQIIGKVSKISHYPVHSPPVKGTRPVTEVTISLGALATEKDFERLKRYFQSSGLEKKIK